MGLRVSIKSSILLSISFLLGSQLSTAAEGQFYIAPGLQWLEFDDNVNLDSDTGPFLGLGYDISERLSIEFSTFEIETKQQSGASVDLDHYKLDFLYDLDFSLGAFTPFVVGGLGNIDTDGSNDTVWDYGVGVNYELAENLFWRTAIRGYSSFRRDHEDSDIGVDTALVYYFGNGGSRPSPAPTPTPTPTPSVASSTESAPDADRDGVPDSRDNCADTPRNYAVDSSGCPIPVEEVARVELLVNFDFDQSEVKPEYFSEIQEVADFMGQYPDVVVELEGHTDSRGTEQYNRGLSDRRANAVRGVLLNRFNVQASRVSASGFGESQPVASNDSDAGRAQNRRVITVIIKTLQNYRPR